MPSSDSDDFESADEGHSSPNKRERKKRLSSSNNSDNIESEQVLKKSQPTVPNKLEAPKQEDVVIQNSDGWDDFDIDEEPNPTNSNTEKDIKNVSSKTGTISVSETKDSGWDDFDDWGDDNVVKDNQEKTESLPQNNSQEPQESAKSSWGWGWGVDSLLSSATAGISNLTTQVSQGISTVLETGIGAPDPEELARSSVKNEQLTEKAGEKSEGRSEDSGDPFQFGSLLSGVTKFVETTGSKVITGGLDTLETIGKKTMEVLQDGDPGLAKKKAMLGLVDKPVLSRILREAKEKADKEDLVKEAKREAKEVHYETLFDDFEGLVHLEALEMLSKQVNMRIEEKLRASEPAKRQDIKETLQQVNELCEMPEEDDEEDETPEDISKPEAFHERLLKATRDIGVQMQFQPLIKQYNEVLTKLEEQETSRNTYKLAVSSLAHTTALAVEVYHKTAEVLLVKNRRSTVDEADAVTQMTVVLTKHISELATQFTDKLTNIPSDKEETNNYITNIFLEAGNSSKYIENAFQLSLPIIQMGAV